MRKKEVCRNRGIEESRKLESRKRENETELALRGTGQTQIQAFREAAAVYQMSGDASDL